MTTVLLTDHLDSFAGRQMSLGHASHSSAIETAKFTISTVVSSLRAASDVADRDGDGHEAGMYLIFIKRLRVLLRECETADSEEAVASLSSSAAQAAVDLRQVVIDLGRSTTPLQEVYKSAPAVLDTLANFLEDLAR